MDPLDLLLFFLGGGGWGVVGGWGWLAKRKKKTLSKVF